MDGGLHKVFVDGDDDFKEALRTWGFVACAVARRGALRVFRVLWEALDLSGGHTVDVDLAELDFGGFEAGGGDDGCDEFHEALIGA